MSNEQLFTITEWKLLQVGVSKKLDGFEILQDVIMLYTAEPLFRKASISKAIRELYGDDEGDAAVTDMIGSARYAVRAAFDNKDAWKTVLYPYKRVPATQEFCRLISDAVSQELAKEQAAPGWKTRQAAKEKGTPLF